MPGQRLIGSFRRNTYQIFLSSRSNWPSGASRSAARMGGFYSIGWPPAQADPTDEGSGVTVGVSLRAPELRSRRRLPVRLEPRDRADRRHDGDGQGRPCLALPLEHAALTSIRSRPRRWVFDAHDRAFAFFKGDCTCGIYGNMRAGGGDLRRARTSL